MQNKYLMRFFWFSFGFFLMAFSLLSTAETIPATLLSTPTNASQCSASISPAECAGKVSSSYTQYAWGWQVVNGYCNVVGITYSHINIGRCIPYNLPIYSCPSGQNWTLSGSSCMRPDCAAGEARNVSNGICEAPPCNVPENGQVGSDFYGFPLSMPSGTKGCINNCQVYSGGSTYEKDGQRYSKAWSYGSSCTGQTTTPVPEAPPEQKTCQQSGLCSGIVNGKTFCVPCSSTSTEQKSTTTNTPASGTPSTTTSTTTNTCTAAGSCTSTTTVSNSSGGSSVNNTTAPSASNGKGTAVSDGQGNYKLDLPTDYQRDATGSKTNDLLTELKDAFGRPVDDDSSITNAAANQASVKALDDADKSAADFVTGITQNSSVTNSVSLWSQTMSTGWFSPITMTGCSPFTATIAGRSWTLDHCPTAAKISDIGAYCMWILLCFSGFRLVTTPRKVEV